MVTFNEVAGNTLLFFLVFGMSATVDFNMLMVQLQNVKALLMGVFLQFGVLPLLGFIVVKFFAGLEQAAGISLLIVTCSPGGSYSNWWCSIFNADLALSVTMTAISTVLSVILMPANLLLYSRFVYDADIVQNIDFNALFIALSMVISAIGLGLFASAKVHSYKFNILANKLGNYAGIALVIFSAVLANSGGGDTKIWNHEWRFYVGVMLPCLGALLLSNIFTSLILLQKPERVTLSVECCYQNVGIATSVALTMFKGENLSTAMAVPLYYGFLEATLLGVYCIGAWKAGWTKAPRNVSFLTMISTSYEVLSTEHGELVAVEVSLPKNQKDLREKRKLSTDGNILHLKHSITQEDDEFDEKKTGLWCFPTPSGPKEASGLKLPDLPEEESQEGGQHNFFHLWTNNNSAGKEVE